MATWMLYAVAAAAGLGAVGLLAERGLALLGRPRRWPWLIIMLASFVWPFASAPLLGDGARRLGSAAVSTLLPDGSGAAVVSRMAPGVLMGSVADTLLLGAWCVASSLLLVVLLLSAESLKGDRRRWCIGAVAGELVFLSGNLGPAVIGTVRPTIVLPRWVLDMDGSQQRLIVLHEREHVRAGDSRLLMVGFLLLVLLPWCLPLWWQFHRLRLAIETDCDARLLRAGASARDYAEVLLAVARRRRRAVLPLAAMAPSRAELERRIHLIMVGARTGRARSALPLLATAALGSLITAAVPAPRSPSLTALLRPTPSGAPGVAQWMPISDGSLPGDPGEQRLDAEIRAHHSAAISSGLPVGSILWFIVDRTGAVAHTGIERGSEREVVARIRSRYPTETSDYALAFDGVPAGAGEAHVVWLLPR